jgi:3-O-alpha-D-mannopyranosyl-alpha-D-mannopyranose xylosylphosphotransferase
MRSVLASFPGSLRTFHLITADDPFTLPQDLGLLSPQQIRKLEALMPTPAGERVMYKPPTPKAVTGTAEVFGRDSNDTKTDFEKRDLPAVSRALADHLAANWRVAQAPSWLDYSKLDPASRDHPYYLKDSSSNTVGHRKGKHSYPNLRYAGHSEIFHLPTLDRDGKTEELGEREWREKEWKKEALPSFNSMAIESRIGWLPGLVRILDASLHTSLMLTG